MKRFVSLLLAVVFCCGLILSAIPPAAAVAAVFITPGDARKVSLNLLEIMADKADDELVDLNLYLNGPNYEEIEAQIPVPDPGADATSEERDAYDRLRYQTRSSIYRELIEAFIEKYLDDTAKIGAYMFDRPPGLQCRVQKCKIPALTELDEVLWINRMGVSVFLVEETPAEDKITEPLREYMQTAADDDRITVRLWLRGSAAEEVELLTDVDYPTLSSTAEEIQAYKSARQEASQERYNDPYGIFAQYHLDEDDEILYPGIKGSVPIIIVTVPKSKIIPLAKLRIVSQVDSAVGYEEAFPDPELPEDPDALNKLQASLCEFMAISPHDEMIPINLDLNKSTDVDNDTLTTAFVQNHLDEGDQILFRSRYTATVRAIVPKYKVAVLAALDEVSQISWIPDHADPAYPASGDAVYVKAESETTDEPDPPAEPDYMKKLSSDLIEYLEGKPDNTMIPIGVDLQGPTDEEVQALITVPTPDLTSTPEEINAYNVALRAARRELYTAITTAFVEEHLDETDEIYRLMNYSPYVRIGVPKWKIYTLAALDEVTQISLSRQDTPLTPTEHEEPVNYDALNQAIAEAEKLQWNDYTGSTADAVYVALRDARNALQSTSQQEVDAAVRALNDAMDALVPKQALDWTELNELVAIANALDPNRYTTESFMEFLDLKGGICLDDLVSAETQQHIDRAAQALREALAVLVEKPCEHEYEAVVTAPTCTEAGYTTHTCTKCGDSYTDTEVAALGHNFVDGVCTRCGEKEAVPAVDKSALISAIRDAEAISLREDVEFTPESSAALKETFDAAKAVNSDPDATQAEIDKAAADLNAAIDALEIIPDEPPEDFRFDDVKDPAKFYYAPVYWAYEAEPQITKGVDDTHFGPDASCTRGQVVTFLWRAAGCPEPKDTKTGFADVPEKAFYAKAVAWAVEKGITKGMSDTAFDPNATCTRGQIVTFLWRFNGEDEPKSAKTDFSDVPETAFYAKAVAWAVENEVTNGMTPTTFAPGSTCTRGQVVTFLYRAAGIAG